MFGELSKKKAAWDLDRKQKGMHASHKKRIDLYMIIKGFLNASGSSSANEVFDWYLKKMDRRLLKLPSWLRRIMSALQIKNEPGLRGMLESCRDKQGISFNNVLKPWIPDDEFRILSASASSDITESLDVMIGMAEEKENTRELIVSSISSAMPTIAIGLLLHYVIFVGMYEAFATASADTPFTDDLSDIDKNYLIYNWIAEKWYLVVGAFMGFGAFLAWSVKSWHKRGLKLREELFDFLPPYSLYKANQQYQLVLIVYNFLRIGKSFTESIQEAYKGSSPYMQMQIRRIQENASTKASDSFNIFYMGEVGDLVSERSEHSAMEDAMEDLLPIMRENKNETFKKVVSRSMWLTIKPAVFISLFYSALPVAMEIYEMVSATQDLS